MRKLILLLSLLLPFSANAQTITKGINFSPLQSTNPCQSMSSQVCQWIDPTNEQVHFFDGTNAKTIPSIIATVKGDIAVFAGAIWLVLHAGTNGQCLQAQSGTATGLQWGSCGANAGNFTFTVPNSNTLDLSGAAVMSIAPATATSISLGAASIGTTVNGTETLAHGVVASGSSAVDFSGDSGAFKTSTGANAFGGSSNTFTNGIVGSTSNMSYLDSTGSGVGIMASLPQLWVANIAYFQWYTSYFIPLATASLGLKTIPWTGVYNNGPMSGGLTSSSTATSTIAATTAIEVLTFGGVRTATLPAANTVIAGGIILVADGAPAATGAGGTISVARSGSDTINGGTGNVIVVTTANSHSTCIDVDSTSQWICGTNN
jgi:hypothetical protein